MPLCLIGSIAFTGFYRMRQGGKTERRRLGPYSDNREWERIQFAHIQSRYCWRRIQNPFQELWTIVADPHELFGLISSLLGFVDKTISHLFPEVWSTRKNPEIIIVVSTNKGIGVIGCQG